MKYQCQLAKFPPRFSVSKICEINVDGDAVDSPLVPKPKRKRAPAADNTGEEGANVFKTSLRKRQANAEYKRLRREREAAAAEQQTTLPQGV